MLVRPHPLRDLSRVRDPRTLCSPAFMATSLLQSQLATLQPSSDSLVVDIAELPEKICQQIIDDLGLG